MKKNKTYFSKPTQVRVEDPDRESGWVYGIAFGENFICACCGGVYELAELNEDGLAIETLEWVDLTEYIM